MRSLRVIGAAVRNGIRLTNARLCRSSQRQSRRRLPRSCARPRWCCCGRPRSPRRPLATIPPARQSVDEVPLRIRLARPAAVRPARPMDPGEDLGRSPRSQGRSARIARASREPSGRPAHACRQWATPSAHRRGSSRAGPSVSARRGRGAAPAAGRARIRRPRRQGRQRPPGGRQPRPDRQGSDQPAPDRRQDPQVAVHQCSTDSRARRRSATA